MYRRSFKGTAVIFSVVSLATAAFAQSAQDSGWRKFGTASGDQAYELNQGAPAQNSQAQPPQNYSQVAAVPSQLTLPAGTFVRVRVNEKLSSDKNQAGDLFTATLVQPLIANGLVISPDVSPRLSKRRTARAGPAWVWN